MRLRFHVAARDAATFPPGVIPPGRGRLLSEAEFSARMAVLSCLMANLESGRADPMLGQVFAPLWRDDEALVSLVCVHGVPEPYDAFVRLLDGRPTIFFNLSLWPEEALADQGPGLLLHEVSHILSAPFLPLPGETDYAAQLSYLVVNEGIAHFLGLPKVRSRLLKDFFPRHEAAEMALAKAWERVTDDRVSCREKQELVQRGNAGPFWEKFASIAGLFRAARLFESQGAAGLTQALRVGMLKPIDETSASSG